MEMRCSELEEQASNESLEKVGTVTVKLEVVFELTRRVLESERQRV